MRPFQFLKYHKTCGLEKKRAVSRVPRSSSAMCSFHVFSFSASFEAQTAQKFIDQWLGQKKQDQKYYACVDCNISQDSHCLSGNVEWKWREIFLDLANKMSSLQNCTEEQPVNLTLDIMHISPSGPPLSLTFKQTSTVQTCTKLSNELPGRIGPKLWSYWPELICTQHAGIRSSLRTGAFHIFMSHVFHLKKCTRTCCFFQEIGTPSFF